MPTAFIGPHVITLPSRVVAGEPHTELSADIINHIWLARISSRLRWLLDKGVIDRNTLQEKADELSLEEMEPYSVGDDADDKDPVFVEAMAIAREIITIRMSAEGLPAPKGLDDHARALVQAMPNLVEKARQRVEARYRSATAALGAL